MATTSYATGANETVKTWESKLARETLKKTSIEKFIGSDENSLIVIKNDLKKSAGDRIRCTLNMLLTGAGVVGDGTQEGNEESLSTYTDDLLIDQLRHACRSAGKMSEQRVAFDVRKAHMERLSKWWAGRIDRWFFTQICGYTAGSVTERGETYDGSDLRYTGQNATLAPDSTSLYRWDATSDLVSAASDEDLVAADTMDLTALDYIKAEAETRSPMINPIMHEGERLYVWFGDTLQIRDLRINTNTGQWQDIQKAAMQGGDVKKNPIFKGSLGMYNNIIIHPSSRITQGVNSSTGAAISTVRRSVFAGAQAAAMGFGKGHSFKKFSWKEKEFDYDNQTGVSAGCIGGLKKTRWNGADFGALVLSTYAA